MHSQKVEYLYYWTFVLLLFGLVKQQLSYDPSDPLPDYSKENPSGLKKVLELYRNDNYYPTFFEKAAYLFVGIIKGHYYSNGNKRLAFVALLYFLAINNYELKQSRPGDLRRLAVFIADKSKNNNASFDELKYIVVKYLESRIYKKS